VQSDELYLPKGKSVRFGLHSKDVIHAFWIPAFRLQEDVVPGLTVHYRATPDRVGNYPIVCNLLCGLGHSLMRSTVHVVAPAQFQAWLKSRQGAAGTGGPGASGAAATSTSGGAATG
jgi:cytochrome c oxidase subunit 2